jgi:NAD(P)-dependent dehydrogenase (short-subunit alcohol dehydrogenase family)
MSTELFSLAGKRALVTGASGGLGQAIGAAMRAAGAEVVLSDRGTQMAGAISADLSDPDAPPALARAAGPIDALVCNAGIEGPVGPLAYATRDDFDRVMQVNLRAAMDLCAALIPGMAERGGGSVTLIASIAALRGNRAIGLYALTKAALTQLARNLAVEWGPAGVRVNAIAPGLIRTPLAQGLLADPAFMARRLAATPLRRVGEPEEIAGLAVMLASRAGGYITGQTIVADGGTLISDGS